MGMWEFSFLKSCSYSLPFLAGGVVWLVWSVIIEHWLLTLPAIFPALLAA
jgi:hypothetical protein